MYLKKGFGKYLVKLREARGLTSKLLATACGITERGVFNLESGYEQSSASPQMLWLVSQVVAEGNDEFWVMAGAVPLDVTEMCEREPKIWPLVRLFYWANVEGVDVLPAAKKLQDKLNQLRAAKTKAERERRKGSTEPDQPS